MVKVLTVIRDNDVRKLANMYLMAASGNALDINGVSTPQEAMKILKNYDAVIIEGRPSEIAGLSKLILKVNPNIHILAYTGADPTERLAMEAVLNTDLEKSNGKTNVYPKMVEGGGDSLNTFVRMSDWITERFNVVSASRS